MKKTAKYKVNNDLTSFLFPIIGPKAEKASQYLQLYRIETKSQLIGIARRRVPGLTSKNAMVKGVSLSYLNSRKHHSPDLIIEQLRRAMHINEEEAKMVFRICNRESSGLQHYNFNSGWAFGSVRTKSNKVHSGDFWRHVRSLKISGGFYIVPEYDDAGHIFDQGERGTCVANSICTQLNYLTQASWSRQFIYHQAKMVDGRPNEEGTFIETATELLNEANFVDMGNIEENIWPYNPIVGRTTHQGPPPEKAYKAKRVYSDSEAVFARQSSLVNDIIYLLNDKVHGKGRLLTIGIAIHESFFSYSTAETGWVTMPLPGEAIVGYHAMTICGYDDNRQLFLVRNSWGPHWAHNNDKGYNGHAWIPYRYIEDYCHVAVSLGYLKTAQMVIPEEERLCNRVVTRIYAGELAAARNQRKMYSRKKNARISIGGWLLRIAAFLLIWHAYKEPILKATEDFRTRVEENINLNEIRSVIADFKEKINQ